MQEEKCIEYVNEGYWTILEYFNKTFGFCIISDISFLIQNHYNFFVDYIWHNDEIPYEAKAKCRRGHTYYSNSVMANDTDIDLPSDVDSLLDYSNKNICYFCICSVDGKSAGCIHRMPWFCERYRYWREHDAPRNMYAKLFKQDRPTYFRQLSYRIRRTMDDGLYDLINRRTGMLFQTGFWVFCSTCVCLCSWLWVLFQLQLIKQILNYVLSNMQTKIKNKNK